MEASDVAKLRELEKENAELKKMYAELSIDNRALKNLLEKKFWRLRSNGKLLTF